jgi:hypothetical protein
MVVGSKEGGRRGRRATPVQTETLMMMKRKRTMQQQST